MIMGKQRPSTGHEERPHTADWSLYVWAEDLPSLLVEAARGMYALSGARLAPGPRTTRTFEFTAPDAEDMLVAFLSELVYSAEVEKVGYDQFAAKIENSLLSVEMSGAPLVAISKTIKAATYHNLHIRQTVRGFETEIVFDV
jgi:SHS2 domain-containing protein